MGLFTNPLSYAGYPPNVTGTPTTQNSTVRAATQAEVTAADLEGTYISPVTLEGAFESPPTGGIGTTTPVPVNATEVTAESIELDAPSVSGASPIVNNSRAGQVRFSDVVANGAYATLTMTNSSITGTSTVVLCSPACATANCRIGIVNITPTAGSVDFRAYNSGSASSDTAVVINYIVVN